MLALPRQLIQSYNVKYEVHKWLKEQSKDFNSADSANLIKKWEKYINVNSNHIKNNRLNSYISFISLFY